MYILAVRQGGVSMADVCYITYNKVVKEYLEVKDGVENVKNTATSFVLCEIDDDFEKIEEMRKELVENRKGEHTRIEVSAVGAILAVKRVRFNKTEFLKIIVYEDQDIKNIRDVFYADTLSVKETVTEVVKMGIGLIRSDVKDLVNIIEKAYRRLELAEDVQETGRTCWLKEIANMCMQEINKSIEIKEKEEKDIKVSLNYSPLYGESGSKSHSYCV